MRKVLKKQTNINGNKVGTLLNANIIVIKNDKAEFYLNRSLLVVGTAGAIK